ncbi:hypothetical protein CF319_g3577 [Tilletia indica]|nr:hypothetical protein CF319_g3577 [Tilletia indica]
MMTTKVASFLVLAALAQADTFGDSFCKGSLCVTAVFDDQASSVSYTAVTSGKVGWVGVGQGDRMAGANMMVGWPQPDGTVVLSQRSTTSHMPPTTATLTNAFVPDQAASTTNASMTIFRWTFPVSAGFASGSTSHIFAISPTSPNSPDPSAPIGKHNRHGIFDLDFTKATTSADVPASVPFSAGTFGTKSGSSGSIPKMRDLSVMSTRLFLAHMIVMSIAWMGLVPAGILIGRYGRTLLPNSWFKVHRAVQTSAVLFIVAGFALGVSAVKKDGLPHFDNTHKRLGLAMFILVLIQASWGQIGHLIFRSTAIRLQNFGHILLGVVLFFGLSLWQVRSGLELWTWQPPSAIRDVVFPVWFAVVTFLWLVGLLLLPRDLKAIKQFQEKIRISKEQ